MNFKKCKKYPPHSVGGIQTVEKPLEEIKLQEVF